MVSKNPFDQFRIECQTALADALKKALPEMKQPTITLNKTPNIDFGQFASSLCFELAKKLNQKPLVLAEQFVAASTNQVLTSSKRLRLQVQGT